MCCIWASGSSMPNTMASKEHPFPLPSGNDVNDADDIHIPSVEYPDWAKEKQYDGVVLYCSGDADHAYAFKQIIERFISLEDGKGANVCVIDRTADIAYIAGRFSALEEAMKRSTFLFLLVSENFCNKEEVQAEWLRDEALMEVLHNPERRWCLIPIHTGRNQKIPFGIRALRGIAITGLLQGKDFKDVTAEDVEQLERKELDKTILQNITTTLNAKINNRIQRERKHAKRVDEWVNERKFELWKELTEEKHMEKLKRERREKAEKAHLEHLDSKDAKECTLAVASSATTQQVLERLKKEIEQHWKSGIGLAEINKILQEECKKYRPEIYTSGVTFLFSLQEGSSAPIRSNPANSVIIINNAQNVQVGSDNVINKDTLSSEEAATCTEENDYEIIEYDELPSSDSPVDHSFDSNKAKTTMNPVIHATQVHERLLQTASTRTPVADSTPVCVRHDKMENDNEVDCSDNSSGHNSLSDDTETCRKYISSGMERMDLQRQNDVRTAALTVDDVRTYGIEPVSDNTSFQVNSESMGIELQEIRVSQTCDDDEETQPLKRK